MVNVLPTTMPKGSDIGIVEPGFYLTDIFFYSLFPVNLNVFFLFKKLLLFYVLCSPPPTFFQMKVHEEQDWW